MNDDASRTVSVFEANKITCIGQATIRKAIDDGKLSAIRIGERRIRIRPESLERWVKSLEQDSKVVS